MNAPIKAVSMKRNIVSMTLGNGLFSAAQWGILMVLARLSGPADVGYYSYALALVGTIMIASQLALRNVYVTDAANQYPFPYYEHVRGYATLCGGLVIIALCLFFPLPAPDIILALMVAKGVENMTDIHYAAYQKNERLDYIARSLTLRSIGGLAVFTGVFYITHNVALSILALALVWLAVYILLDSKSHITNMVNTSTPITFAGLKQVTTIAIPLTIVLTLVSFNISIPRYILEYKWGAETLGIFAAMAYFISVGNMVINAIGQTLSPKLARQYNDHQFNAFYKLLGRGLLIVASLGVMGVIGVLLIGQPLIRLMYGDAFTGYNHIFIIITIAATIGYMGNILLYGVTATRAFTAMLIPTLAVSLSSIAVGYILISAYALMGGALTLLFMGFANILASIYVLYTRHMRIIHNP